MRLASSESCSSDSSKRSQPVEQAAEVVIGEALVDDPAERCERFRSGRVPAGRHHDLLVPGEDASCASEIGDLGEALPERAKVGVHRRRLYLRR